MTRCPCCRRGAGVRRTPPPVSVSVLSKRWRRCAASVLEKETEMAKFIVVEDTSSEVRMFPVDLIADIRWPRGGQGSPAIFTFRDDASRSITVEHLTEEDYGPAFANGDTVVDLTFDQARNRTEFDNQMRRLNKA